MRAADSDARCRFAPATRSLRLGGGARSRPFLPDAASVDDHRYLHTAQSRSVFTIQERLHTVQERLHTVQELPFLSGGGTAISLPAGSPRWPQAHFRRVRMKAQPVRRGVRSAGAAPWRTSEPAGVGVAAAASPALRQLLQRLIS